MMAPTHIAFGVFSVTGLFSLFSISLHRDLPALGATILGSVLPDIDSPKSSVGRLLPFVAVPIERRWGHRTVTHCLLMVGALGAVCLPLCFWQPTLYAALLMGYLSHLVADCATKSGVPLFYPQPSSCVLPGNSRYRVRTGSLAERIVFIVLLFLLALTFPVASLGGTWRALHYVMATQSAAYSDYREAATEALLDFEGRWRVSRQPVQGKALILDGSPDRFLIAFRGDVWVYGEQGDILPDQSRVEATEAAIQMDTLDVEDLGLAQVLEQIPPRTFVSGQLQGDRPFYPRAKGVLSPGRHDGLRLIGQTVVCASAPRSRLALIDPVRKTDPERLAQTQQLIENAELELRALQLRRPPVHYLRRRKAESVLEAHRQTLAELGDSTVWFSGRLLLRILGEDGE